MSMLLYHRDGWPAPCSVLNVFDDFGIPAANLLHPPRRFWTRDDQPPPLIEASQDLALLTPVPTPAQLLSDLPGEDSIQTHTRRSLARLYAHFLICEDPQRRMDARAVDTLSHQVTLVQHVLQSEHLRKVLIADEVGLGKTVEVGLILQGLFERRPHLRVLYLAPARLVRNVWRELERLDLKFRMWVAGGGDARLDDARVVASIHRAVVSDNHQKFVQAPPWNVVVVDECHHLSAWSPDGTDARRAYTLVQDLIRKMPAGGNVILLSGTPHQGHATRFDNLLRLLRDPTEPADSLRGRVIYRTKDDIRDWEGNPVFPPRRVNPPLTLDLAPSHRLWLDHIHDFYTTPIASFGGAEYRRRAAGWRCAQALQWAVSSPNAGLGYLVRQAVRARWSLDNPILSRAVAALRPYRLGPPDERVDLLFERLQREVGPRSDNDVLDDIELGEDALPQDWFTTRGLESLIEEGIAVLGSHGDDKWERVFAELLQPAGADKVVMFAQPIETVTAVAGYLHRRTGTKPALILGGQDDEARDREVASFLSPDGAQFLVSSRAGGEGINLQVARRLVHLDVPWNPMDMEQRVGRIHRFGSRHTILVDTVVVRDSRETHMYEVARSKLRTIAQTLVEPERFETVFSRVMSLLSSEELQDILIHQPAAPLSPEDQQRLAEMVQHGFQTWSEFHQRYGRRLESIQRGLLEWDDVIHFLTELGGAGVRDDHQRWSFRKENGEVEAEIQPAKVLEFKDKTCYVTADYGENLVYDANGKPTPRLGLNRKQVVDLLRECAISPGPLGAAHILWPENHPSPSRGGSREFAALVFLRHTVRLERHDQTEHATELWCYLLEGETTELVTGERKAGLLRGLVRGRPRRSRKISDALLESLRAAESQIVAELRRPSARDRGEQLRHAVTPLLAAVVAVE